MSGQQVGAIIFPFKPDQTQMQFTRGLGANIVFFESGKSQTIAQDEIPRNLIEFTFRLTSDEFDKLTSFFQAQGGPEKPFLLPSWTRDAVLTAEANANSTSISVDSVLPFTTKELALGNIIILYDRGQDNFEANLIKDISDSTIKLKAPLTLSFPSGAQVFRAFPVRFESDTLTRNFIAADVYDVTIRFSEETDPNEIATAILISLHYNIEEWLSSVDTSRLGAFARWRYLLLSQQYPSNRFPETPYQSSESYTSTPLLLPRNPAQIRWSELVQFHSTAKVYTRAANSPKNLVLQDWTQVSNESQNLPQGRWFQVRVDLTRGYISSVSPVRASLSSSPQLTNNIAKVMTGAGWTLVDSYTDAKGLEHRVLENIFGDQVHIYAPNLYEIAATCVAGWSTLSHSAEYETDPSWIQYNLATTISISATDARTVLWDDSDGWSAIYFGRLCGYPREFLRGNTSFWAGFNLPAGSTAGGYGVLEILTEELPAMQGVSYYPSLGLTNLISESLRIPEELPGVTISGWIFQNLVMADHPLMDRVFGELLGVWWAARGANYYPKTIDFYYFTAVRVPMPLDDPDNYLIVY